MYRRLFRSSNRKPFYLLVGFVGLCVLFIGSSDVLPAYLDLYLDHRSVLRPASEFITNFDTTSTSGLARNETIDVKFMTPYFGGWVNHWRSVISDYSEGRCPSKCAFNYSLGPNNGSSSQVLVFHANDLALHPECLPSERHADQTWLLMNAEGPWLTTLDMVKYNNVFNWTSFVREDSDLPVYYAKRKKLDQPLPVPDVLPKKKHAYWMVSNCYATNHRDAYMDSLKRHIHVDVYSDGPCHPGAIRCPKRHPKCDRLASEYNFYFALENANCRGYISEKLWRSLAAGVIPVVMGDSEGYKRVAPPGSYIDVANFSSPQKLADYLIEVEHNLTLYQSYFAWRSDYDIVDEWLCDLCEKLHDRDGSHQVYNDLRGWYKQDICSTWNVVGHVFSRTTAVWRVIKRWAWWLLGLSNHARDVR